MVEIPTFQGDHRISDSIAISDSENKLRNTLLDSGVFIPERLIRNPHMERPLWVTDASFEEAQEALHSLDLVGQELKTVDFYYDVNESFAQNNINARLRFYGDPNDKTFSIRNIATFETGEEYSESWLGGLRFKKETVYLNREDADFQGYLERLARGAKDVNIVGFIKKNSVRYQIKPWGHVASRHGGLTMIDDWANMKLDLVSLYVVDDLPELFAKLPGLFNGRNPQLGEVVDTVPSKLMGDIVMVELEGSYGQGAQGELSRLAQRLDKLNLATQFQTKRKSALLGSAKERS